jgi:LacI family transcriptional regulator
MRIHGKCMRMHCESKDNLRDIRRAHRGKGATREQHRMRATQYDIARLTGLSQATISRALRGDASVVPQTRERIAEACATLGYRPSVGGRVLAEGRRAIIGISLSRDALPTDRYVTLMYQALVSELESSGWGVTLLAAEDLLARLTTVGAVILIGVEEDDPRVPLCHNAGVPVVAIGYLSNPEVFSVVPDDADGARQVVRHFHASGCKRFLMMSSFNKGKGPAMGRRADEAMAEARGLGMSTDRIEAIDDITSTLSGYRTARRQEAVLRRADCLFCDTDEHALGAIVALSDMGIAVPTSLRVAGFDDLPVISARLTTVHQDFREIARTTIALRQRAVSGEPAVRIVVPVKLMMRET